MYYAGYAAAPSCAIEDHKDISMAVRNEISAKQIGDYLKYFTITYIDRIIPYTTNS